MYEKKTYNIVLNGENLEALPLKLRIKQFALSPFLLNTFHEALAEIERQETEILNK